MRRARGGFLRRGSLIDYKKKESLYNKHTANILNVLVINEGHNNDVDGSLMNILTFSLKYFKLIAILPHLLSLR